MTSISRAAACAFVLAVASALSCRAPAEDAERNRPADSTVARDTAAKAWKHEVGVDSTVTRGDTTIVWVSPRNFLATDGPQAGVRVLGGRIVAIQWILGG